MFGDNLYGMVEVEMLAEANRIITEEFTDEQQADSSQKAKQGHRSAIVNLLRGRPALRPQPAGFHHEATPCVEC